MDGRRDRCDPLANYSLIARVWLVVADIPQLKLHTTRTMVAGVLLAIAGLLLIVAAHWGHFG